MAFEKFSDMYILQLFRSVMSQVIATPIYFRMTIKFLIPLHMDRYEAGVIFHVAFRTIRPKRRTIKSAGMAKDSLAGRDFDFNWRLTNAAVERWKTSSGILLRTTRPTDYLMKNDSTRNSFI